MVSTELLLTPAQVERYKKLEKKQLEVWQVVVRKLRVWSASSAGDDDGKDAVPCRPYCILVNNLYPLGQVVSKKICDPPEVYPSPQTVLELTLRAMVDPPTNTPQHRPDKISFPDKHFVGQLRKSYAALGIECSYLSESDGIDAYIQYAMTLSEESVTSSSSLTRICAVCCCFIQGAVKPPRQKRFGVCGRGERPPGNAVWPGYHTRAATRLLRSVRDLRAA